ncbi:hypothetical protein K432DRAFT_392912 [Lepidopterella palustris CBS 459.81]|uniref:Ankyrin n=1 Tax=Lepidopterella palustris CBS 459.81 TaxID=1314670 RepID=A0A8E2JFG4_9PEZI|nr:hypothetical protein K432DRAFT_392912 [Lepidopterella palustris CBS 459.81]
MDLPSVAGVVSAVVSLTATCSNVIQILNELAERHKEAEPSILTTIEECRTIQLAWTRIEQWASHFPHDVEDHEQVFERLQRSIHTGQLVMSALENDLAPLRTAKATGFRRRSKFIWNDKLLQNHQDRIRGQIDALLIILEVLGLSSHSERVELLSVKESVFRDVDENVRLMEPSRSSVCDSDRMSIKSYISTDLRHIPFAFENVLFSSHVYKRNLRFPNMKKMLPKRTSSIRAESLRPSASTKSTKEGLNPEKSKAKSTRLTFDDPKTPAEIEEIDDDLIDAVNERNYHLAIDHLRKGADIRVLCRYVDGVLVSGNWNYMGYTFGLLDELRHQDAPLFITVMQVFGFTYGEPALETMFLHLTAPDGTSSRKKDRDDAENKARTGDTTIPSSVLEDSLIFSAGKLHDEAVTDLPKARNLAVLQLACLAAKPDVVEYILQTGAPPQPKDPARHPFILATLRRCYPIMELFLKMVPLYITDQIRDLAINMIIDKSCILGSKWSHLEEIQHIRFPHDYLYLRFIFENTKRSPSRSIIPILELAIRAAGPFDHASFRVIDEILGTQGVLLSKKDHIPSDSLLFVACRCSQPRIFDVLLKAGAHTLDAKDSNEFNSVMMRLTVSKDPTQIEMASKILSHNNLTSCWPEQFELFKRKMATRKLATLTDEFDAKLSLDLIGSHDESHLDQTSSRPMLSSLEKILT